MSDGVNHGVVGSDGGIPVYEPEARWCQWGLHEIYQGGAGANRFVPKVRDYVVDVDTWTTYKVMALNPVTLIPTLQEIRPSNMSFTLNESDVLFGVGPGTQAQLMRVYINKDVIPHTLAVDQLLRIGGSMSSYAKIFRGANVAVGGEVISKVYDSAGNFVSENVPLEKVVVDNLTNYNWKTVRQCHTTTPLEDNEVLTIVFYSDNGQIVSKSQLLVENTSYIRSLNVSQKYITGISLESPFLSNADAYQIDYPLNIPANGLNLVGVVSYSDGTTARFPVNGQKFTMLGLDQLLSTIVGQSIDLVLRYQLAPNETNYANQSVQSAFITQTYRLVTVNPQNSYTVKLFAYPFWDASILGYRLRFWMFNLDRNFFQEVTSFVNFDAATGAFDPQGYGFVQRKQVSLNLRQVSTAFKAFVHTQLIEVTLFGPPDSTSGNAWTTLQEANTAQLPYGVGLFARRVGQNVVNISAGITDFAEWLEQVYKRTYPLVNTRTEVNAPTPTHVFIGRNAIWQEFAIEDWDKDIGHTGAMDVNASVNLRFIRRSAGGDQILSLGSMIIRA